MVLNQPMGVKNFIENELVPTGFVSYGKRKVAVKGGEECSIWTFHQEIHT